MQEICKHNQRSIALVGLNDSCTGLWLLLSKQFCTSNCQKKCNNFFGMCTNLSEFYEARLKRAIPVCLYYFLHFFHMKKLQEYWAWIYSRYLKLSYSGMMVNGDCFFPWLITWFTVKENERSCRIHDNIILKVYHHTRKVTECYTKTVYKRNAQDSSRQCNMPVGDEAPVLHGTSCKVREGDHILLGERVGQAEVFLKEGKHRWANL